MAEHMTFHKPYGRVALGTLGAAALCPLLFWWYASLLPQDGGAERARWASSSTLVAVAIAVFAAIGLVRAARERLTLDADGLVFRGLLGRRSVRWESVVGLVAPWGMYTDVPLVLRLRRRASRGWLGALAPARFALPGHWAGHEQLVREIVARVPLAALNPRLCAWLEAPHRVPRSHRLVVLAFLALAIGCAAYALLDALAEAVIGIVPGALVVATAVPCALVGSSMGRERRATPALVVAYTVLVVASGVAFLPAMLHGGSGWLLLLLAACLGWALATLAVCLPLRLRGPHAVGLYSMAVLASVGSAWWCGVRESVPVRSTPRLSLADNSLVWSPDGQRIGVQVGDVFTNRREYLVIEGRSSYSQRLPATELAERLYLPAPRRALYLTCLFQRDARGSLGGTRTLWAWDPEAGHTERLALPPHLRIASEGLVSPDGCLAVFLALDHDSARWRLCLLRLADLRVEEVNSPRDFSRFHKVRWMPDGRLVLTERAERLGQSPARLAFWALGLGEKEEPTRLYQAAARDVWERCSPSGRYALVACIRGRKLWDHFELVNLVSGEARAVELPGNPSPHEFVWAPDEKVLAYLRRQEDGETQIVLLDPATGALARVPVHAPGAVTSLAISCGARFAACSVRSDRCTRIHVLELGTGRHLTLRRPLLFPAPIEPVWSPVGHELAVTACEGPLPPASSARIRLLDFSNGW